MIHELEHKEFYLGTVLIKFAIVATVVVATMTALSIAGNSKVAANCPVNSGNLGGFAGMRIETFWHYNDESSGARRAYGGSAYIYVWTYGQISTRPGGVRINGAWLYSKTFPMYYDNGCYGQPGFIIHGFSNREALDCDNSIRRSGGWDSPLQRFGFTGGGVPAGAPAGGSWRQTIMAPPNGGHQVVWVVYTVQRPVVVNWSYQARTTQDSAVPDSNNVEVGQNISGIGSAINIGAGTGTAYNLEIFPSRNATWVDTRSPLASSGLWTGADSKTARWNSMPALGRSQSGPSRNALFTLNSNAQDGLQVCFRTRVSPSTGQSSPSRTSDAGSSHTSGEVCYTVEASAKLPFLEVHGADVWAGGVFADKANWSSLSACSGGTAGPPRHIVSTAPTNYGSIGEIGVLATGDIRNFGSSGDLSSDILSFSNEGAIPGSYFDDGRCLANFFNLFYNEPSTTAFNPTNIATIFDTDGQFRTNIPSGQSLSLAGGAISQGVQQIILVNGDVTISGNISYTNYVTSNRANIPMFVLVVQGDINILDNVTRLDGLYVAIPDDLNTPTNGVIRTCSNAPASITDTDCGNQLTINGTFVAQDVEFERTSGDIDSGGPAEIFEFSPEMYLAESDFVSRFFGGYKADQFKDLPPVY